MVFVLFLTLVLFLICAALPAFVGSSGKELNVEAPATKDEPTQPVTTVPPVTSAATADEPAADGHKIDIEAMFQDELESGCEVYAAVTLLHYYGYEADELEFAEKYVPKSTNYSDGDGYYGPDLNSAFAGEPEFGYGAYAPVLKRAINDYLADNDSEAEAEVERGLTLAELCERYISRDDPVMVWVTTDMELPEEFITWTVDYVDENATAEIGDEFSWPTTEHCMLLTGYDDEYYYFADSLEGITVSYEREQCERVFEELGSQAVVLNAADKEN
jgi:uncharacterized protein YvpB